MLKTFLLDTKKSIYALFGICLFSIIGAIIIHLNPEGYFKIHIYPLFQWLNEHKRLDTFWIYIIIILFAYIALASLYCFVNDIKKRNFLTATMHISVIFFLVAHFISAIWTFRKNDQVLLENIESRIFIREHQKEIKLRVKKIDFKMTQFGIPVNLKGIIQFDNDKTKEISVNNPIKIDAYHLILKDLTGFLTSIETSIKENNEVIRLNFKPNTATKFNNLNWTILDISEDLSTIKFKIDNEKDTLIKFVKTGEYFTINNKKFLIESIKPNFQTALVVDIVYDPSIMIIFISSSLFIISLVTQFIMRFKKIFK